MPEPELQKFEIRHYWSNAVLYATEARSLREAVEKAVSDRARLDGARLDGARLVGARLVGASLVGARLDGASLVGARLDGARLDGASLDGASLDGARLVGASLDRARLDRASLVGASLVGARLDGASLEGASLVGASLVGARLDGASLDGASLVGASLVGARMNWSSHALMAELLYREIRETEGDECDVADAMVDERKVAGLILLSRDWCWEQFLHLNSDPLFPWVITTLAKHVVDGDMAPAILKDAAVNLKATIPTEATPCNS